MDFDWPLLRVIDGVVRKIDLRAKRRAVEKCVGEVVSRRWHP